MNAKAAVYVMAASTDKSKYKLKNKKFVYKHDYIWFKGSTSFTQNYHSFLLNYMNGSRFIIYMIVTNIFFIRINKY